MAPTLSDKLDTIINELGTVRTGQALTSQAVGELSSHVVTLSKKVDCLGERVAVTETRLSERTRPFRTAQSSDPPPRNGRSRARTAGLVGALSGGGLGVLYIVYEIVSRVLERAN